MVNIGVQGEIRDFGIKALRKNSKIVHKVLLNPMAYSGSENYFLRVHTDVLTKETKRTNGRKLTRTFHPDNLHAQAIYV